LWERHLYEAKMQASLVKCADVERTSNFILNGLVCIDSVSELCGTRYNTPILISTTGAAKGKKDKDRNVKWIWFINCINVPNVMCDMKLTVSIFALKHVQHVVRWKPALFADLWGQKKRCPTCDVSDGGMVLMKETEFFEHIDKHQNQRDSCDCDRTSWIPFFHQENGLRRINFGWALVIFFRLICAYGVGFVEIKDSLSDSEVQYVSSTPATRWEHNRIDVKDAGEGYFRYSWGADVVNLQEDLDKWLQQRQACHMTN
jgi:hypothetical protein